MNKINLVSNGTSPHHIIQKALTVFKFNNEKQIEFYDAVMHAMVRLNKLRHFYIGGAIRGGKTYVCLFILLILAKKYPKSRWHVIRSTNGELESTSIPSMEKLIGKSGKNFVWKRNKGNTRVIFSNGSIIFFLSEKLQSDQALTQFLGLETNGILLEQMEGLSERLYSMVIQRIGSWYITPMPPPLLMGTFNPTQTWVKKLIYDKHITNELPDNTMYVEALPEHNPFVTSEQWLNWKNLDPISYNQMIKSIWVFATEGNIWAYAFDYRKTVVDVTTTAGKLWQQIDKTLPVLLIFDFNVDPITCLVCQHNGIHWAKVLYEYRIRNSNIWELLARIKTDLPNTFFLVSGDANAKARFAGMQSNKTNAIIIKEELNLSDSQMRFPNENPSVSNTRTIVNSLFHKHPNFKIGSNCLFLIDDLQTIRTDEKGNIDETQKKKEKLKTHLLDNLRYFCWNFLRTFINYKN